MTTSKEQYQVALSCRTVSRGWQTRQEYEQSRREVEAKLAAGRRLDGSPDMRALKALREDKHDD